jgi:hypothetical protein
LLGLPSGAGKVEQLRNPNSLHMRVYAAYVQDQWRATDDLTLTFGLLARNPIRGPGLWNFDLGLFKMVGLGSRARTQFRLEALNAFNRANFSNPGGDISNANAFGFITSTTGTGERNFRVGLRFWF